MSSELRARHPPGSRGSNIGFRVARWHGATTGNSGDPLDVQALTGQLSHYIATHPMDWQLTYVLASLQRFIGDEQSYRETCRQMLRRFLESESTKGRHELLFAHLFFPSGEVTDEILDLAREHARDGRPVNVRLLGLAFCRRGAFERALPLLEEAAAANVRSADSRITSFLCLALVQLGMDDLEAARETIRRAREAHENSPERVDSRHRLPWGAISSLWSEVQAEMQRKGLDEPIPEGPTITGLQ
jgi:hypothetical protein